MDVKTYQLDYRYHNILSLMDYCHHVLLPTHSKYRHSANIDNENGYWSTYLHLFFCCILCVFMITVSESCRFMLEVYIYWFYCTLLYFSIILLVSVNLRERHVIYIYNHIMLLDTMCSNLGIVLIYNYIQFILYLSFVTEIMN